MVAKKRVSILITLAIVLAIVAISINLEETKTPTTFSQEVGTNGAKVGITIDQNPDSIEDKGLEDQLSGEGS